MMIQLFERGFGLIFFQQKEFFEKIKKNILYIFYHIKKITEKKTFINLSGKMKKIQNHFQ